MAIRSPHEEVATCMNAEALSRQIAEVKSTGQLVELAGTLRNQDQQEVFRVLFAIASDCLAYRWPVYENATNLLLALEPPCPITCREAIEQLGHGNFEASLKKLPFYLIAQFGRPQVLRDAEALFSEPDVAKSVKKAAMLVKYWSQIPASKLIGPWFDWTPPDNAPKPKAPETLNTARLLLRRPRRDDAPLVFSAYGQDAEVTRYLSWQPHKTLSDAQTAIERRLAGWQSGDEIPWMLCNRTDSKVVGAISAWPKRNGIEIGYVLARQYWNRGFMTEAVQAVVEWAFTQPSVFRVWAVCDVENGASARVLEKAGFEREGILKSWAIHPNVSPKPRDCYAYARIRSA
ncbi:MAG TPA: GNAT family N-acetyltransferase [Verrucomicrobiae bacterium]|nr:GNAT family N-acetyltransferase [Verrucomicrobiae bacterium]